MAVGSPVCWLMANTAMLLSPPLNTFLPPTFSTPGATSMPGEAPHARHTWAVAEIDEPAIGMNVDRADELDRKLVGGVGERGRGEQRLRNEIAVRRDPKNGGPHGLDIR